VERFTLTLPDGAITGWQFGRTDGPVDVLFFHATGFTARTYAPLLEPLTDLRIIAIDQRGHGHNSRPADAAALTSWQVYVDDALAVLAHVGGKPLLAGHSMGGTIALMAAARQPHHARSVLMLDPAIMPPWMAIAAQLPGAIGWMRRNVPIAVGAGKRRADFASRDEAIAAYRGRGAFKTWSEDFLQAYVADGFVDAPGGGVTLACRPAWENASFCAMRHNPWLAFRKAACPVTVAAATKGSTIRHSLGSVRFTAPRVRVVDAEGTHMFPMEQAEFVRELIRENL
jgi:pimeloyl-ACP methyl ester carboxylesterase